jgi:hypothetical protein
MSPGNAELRERFASLTSPLVADQRVHAGESLRQQLRFADYLTQKSRDPALTFREHLAGLGGAIEV